MPKFLSALLSIIVKGVVQYIDMWVTKERLHAKETELATIKARAKSSKNADKMEEAIKKAGDVRPIITVKDWNES